MFTGLANKAGPYLSAVLQRDSTKTDSVRLCGNILSVIGLALILTAVFALDSKDFPGYKALLPVMGAVLMIAAGKDSFLNRCLLSNRVMVWFGLISYPLYIWHWPFLSFAWIVGGEMPALKVRVGCVVLAVIMSAVTYYFVEPRLRWGRFGGYKAAGLLSAMIAVGVAGYSVEMHDGYTARMNDPEQPVIDAISKRLEADYQRCLEYIPDWKTASAKGALTKCSFQRASGHNTIAVIGDSHAGHLYPGLIAKTNEDEGIAVFPAECSIPLMGLHSSPNVPGWELTEHALSEGFSYIISHKNITKVILSHNPQCSWDNVVDKLKPGKRDFRAILHDGFARTYNALTKAGKEIYVLFDTPHYYQGFSKCRSSSVRRPSAVPGFLSSKNLKACSVRMSERENTESIDNWKRLAQDAATGYKNIHFIDLTDVFCPNGTCSMLDKKGDLLYQDPEHLAIKGALYAAPFILSKIRE